MNPLDFRGPTFIKFYLVCVAIAVVLGLVIRYLARGRDNAPSSRQIDELHPYEVAYLVGGAKHAILAALAALFHRDRITSEGGSVALSTGTPELELVAENAFRGFARRKEEHPLDLEILSLLARGPMKISEVCARAESTANQLARRLLALDLIRSESTYTRWRRLAVAPLAAVVAMGAIKVGVGVMRSRPILTLVQLLVFTGFPLWRLLARSLGSTQRTRRGERAVTTLSVDNAALTYTARTAPQQLTADELALAYGVFAGGALDEEHFALAGELAKNAVSVALADVSTWAGYDYPRRSSYTGSTCGSSCGSSCGGCCGGCGGCGGCD